MFDNASGFESQRDSIPKPRVARDEPTRSVLVIICSNFPWVKWPNAITTPRGLRPDVSPQTTVRMALKIFLRLGRNPVGVVPWANGFPG